MKRVLILNLGCNDPIFLFDFGLECLDYCIKKKIKVDYIKDMYNNPQKSIFTYTKKGHLLRIKDKENVNILTFNNDNITCKKNLKQIISKLVLNNDFDLIVSMGYHEYLKDLFVKGFLRSPLVIIDFHMLAHIRSFLSGNISYINNLFKRNPIQIISCFPNYSPYYKRCGIPLNKIKWVNYCCNYKTIKPLSNAKENEKIFCGGNHLRDYDVLIKMLENNKEYFLHNNLKINLFAPSCPDILKQNEIVIYRGFVKYKKFLKELREARFVLLPLKNVIKKANGLTVLGLALSFGKALIVTKNKATSSQIIDGYNGLFIESGNSNDMFKKIKYLVENPQKVKELGKNARESGEKDKSYDYLLDLIFNTNWRKKMLVYNYRQNFV